MPACLRVCFPPVDFQPAVHVSGSCPQRLAQRAAEDPEGYKILFSIITKEVEKGDEKGSTSATKGLLWLKR